MCKFISTCLLCLLAFNAHAVIEKPQVLILTTKFVTENKLKKLADTAKPTNVDIVYQYVENIGEESHLRKPVSLIIVDAPRTEDQVLVNRGIDSIPQKDGTPTIQINRFNAQQPLQFQHIKQEHADTIYQYYISGMEANRKNLIQYLDHYLHQKKLDEVEPPQLLPDGGIYHPDAENTVFSSLIDYLSWWSAHRGNWQELPTIAMETTSTYISDAQTAHLDAVIHAIEARGNLPIVYYAKSRTVSRPLAPAKPTAPPEPELANNMFPNPKASQRPAGSEPMLELDGTPLANVLLVNTFLGGDTEGRKARYHKLDIPVLQIIHYRGGNYADYLADNSGIDSYSLPFLLTNAEYIGIQDPVILTTNEDGEMRPVPEQLDLLVNKAVNLASLQRKQNRDKKLALLFWNHPPGETNQGASNLNVPRSLEKLTTDLQQQGYQLSPLAEQTMIDAVATMLRPSYRKDQLPNLMATALWDFLPLSDYQNWFATLPAAVQQQMNTAWGEAGQYSGLVTHQDVPGFVIPRLQSGNLVVLPQPGRGGNSPEEDKDVFHDVKVPMHHYYAAVYLWVREHYQADAIIHFGTHGSQEWHPGKERGLWAYDPPNLAVGSVPVLYPYIVDNIGEAIHVKRRGRGVIISHQTPPFSPAGLSDEFSRINDLLNEHHLLDEGPVKTNNQNQLIEQIITMNIQQDLGWSVNDLQTNFSAFTRELENYLEELGASTQPLGLHTFGQTAAQEHLALTLMLMLQDTLAPALGLEDFAAEFKRDYTQLQQTKPFQFVLQHIVLNEELPTNAEPALQAAVIAGKQQLQDLRADSETASVLTGLAARWINPSYGGDPVRNPDALPTGRNMYGFDPSRVPTKSAYAAGVQALDDLLYSHRQTHAAEPLTKLAFTMWSTETMRHLGMLEAQVLAALGVKPVWGRGGRVSDLELIPLEELDRPRIDTVISLTGLYRDQFPAVIERLNQAIALVSAQDEPADMNPVRANTLALKQSLIDRGHAAELAENLALTRIFGTESGDYGTKLPEATLASDQWSQSDNQLAELYLSRMSWGYGPDTTQWSEKPPVINGTSINLYAEQLKGTQAVVFSRSSNLRGLLDTDHPFEYLGGISLALQHLDGAAPQLYISNLRDPAKARLQTAEQFLASELRAVYQHPNWLKEMKKEGYAGTLELLDTINNFWGWQVMDNRIVRDDQWEEFHQTYINDKYKLDIKEWFEQSNPAALAQITERMLEAVRKEYWDASDTTKKQLVELYQELAEQHDVYSKNEDFKSFVTELAKGYGLSGVAPDLVAASTDPELEDTQADVEQSMLEDVSGQHMKEVAPAETEQIRYWWAWLMLLFISLGAVYQYAELRKQQHTLGDKDDLS